LFDTNAPAWVLDVCKVAASAARDQNFFTDGLGVFEKHHRPAAPAGLDGAHHAGPSRPNDGDVTMPELHRALHFWHNATSSSLRPTKETHSMKTLLTVALILMLSLTFNAGAFAQTAPPSPAPNPDSVARDEGKSAAKTDKKSQRKGKRHKRAKKARPQ